MILNGIEDIIERPDLADRTLFLTLEPIPENRRRLEKELWSDFEQARPKILGALLDAVVSGLRALPDVKLERLPRMADFALWATACETAIGPKGSFASAYGGNRDLAVECVIEGDAVAQAIRALMARRQAWTGTATDLLRDLSNAVDDRTHNDKRWPKDPKALSGRLRRAATFLRNFGIEITFDRVGRERTRTVNIRVQPGPDNDGIEASAASAASAAPRKARPTRGLITTSLWTLGNDADAFKD